MKSKIACVSFDCGFECRRVGKGTGYGRVRQLFDGTMRPGVEGKTFMHSDELVPVRRVDRGSTTSSLRTDVARPASLQSDPKIGEAP